MKKLHAILGIVLVALCFLSASAYAAGPVVTNAWARATTPGIDTCAVFLKVTSPTADRLIGAKSPVATNAMIHLHSMTNGVMTMGPVAGVDLVAGQSFNFAPMGYHIMLTGLKAPLHAGDHFPLTLILAKAGDISVDVRVVPLRQHHTPPAMQPMGSMSGMSGMEMK